jgi:hypothetical protein
VNAVGKQSKEAGNGDGDSDGEENHLRGKQASKAFN